MKDTSVEIIIAVTNNSIYSVTALQELFILDSQLSNAPLFSLANGAVFAHNPVIKILCQRF